MNHARAVFLLATLPLLGALAASCAADLAAPLLDQGCTLNSDCNTPLVCAFQACHQQCQSSRDCPAGERCVSAARPYDVCQLPSERSCQYTSQCPPGQICAIDDQCRDQCAADRDCVAGQVCTAGACADVAELGPSGTLPDARDSGVGLSCQLSSDCGDAGLVCRQGACAIQCNADIDCVPPLGPGGVCNQHVCGPAPVSDAGGDASSDAGNDAPSDAGSDAPADAASDAPPGYGQPCNLPSDCPPSLKCGNAGRCVYQCNAAIDCSPGECCILHECATGLACAPPDAGSDAGGDAGGDACKPCIANDQCQDGLFCNGQEQCFAGCCAPALDTPCDSHSACIQDTCTEATKTCTHVTVAGTDLDGDGHLAIGCAGGDDCDDNDPTVYPGHPEVFDGKDNDCNGIVDDVTSEPKNTSGALATANFYAVNCQLGAAVGGGPGGWLGAAFGIASNPAVAYTTAFDTAWTAAQPTSATLPFNLSYAVDAASEVSTAAFLVANTNLELVVLKPDGSLVGTALLDAGSISGFSTSFMNATWTGHNYLVGWWSGQNVGYFALVDSAANVLGIQPLPVASLKASAQVSVAGNGTSIAVGYTPSSANMALMVLTEGGQLQGTADLGAGSVLAVAGAPSAYVVLAQTAAGVVAIVVPAPNGVPGTPMAPILVDAVGTPISAKGGTDGVGAAFLIQYPGQVSFGYLNATLKNPFELREVAAGGVIANLAGGTDGRLGVFYTIGTHLYGRQAGYASLPGAACTQNLDCASGVCTPKVVGGPKAYSACQ